VSGIIEGVELERLFVRAQLLLDARDVFGRRIRVFGPEQPEQRAAKLRSEVDRRHRPLRRQLVAPTTTRPP